MDMLDFEREKALICDSMREARRSVRLKFEHATTDRLRALVTLGECCGIHYSGHGDPDRLSMEDGRGAAHFVRVPALKKLLQAGSLAGLRFVFVSACFSEAAAQAFVDAGVPHVIAVRLTTRVSDLAAHAFTRAFYPALAVGHTIRAAFDIGVQAVVTSPNVPAADVEGDKFLLLGRGRGSEIPFPNLARLESGWEPLAPAAARNQLPLPAISEAFLGRNVETYRVVTAVLDRRLVTIAGPRGVGKSAVAVAAIDYLATRRHFSDGVVYVDCADAATIGDLSARLYARVARITDATPAPADAPAAAPSDPPPPSPLASAAADVDGHAPNGSGAAARLGGGAEGGAGARLRAADSPLVGLHCVLVLDALRPSLVSSQPFADLLVVLLGFPRVRTLLTAVVPVGRPLQGGAEKVIELQPLSRVNSARLLCKLSPRPLLLSELPGAGSAKDFVQRLAELDVIGGLRGNPGLIKEAAPRLSHLRLHELEVQHHQKAVLGAMATDGEDALGGGSGLCRNPGE